MISVLYVDDWLPLLDTIGRILERKGDMTVETASSIEEALRKLDYLSFDVIVTDYNSRESAGIDLLRQTRQMGIIAPFIFFTLEQNRGLELEATQYGRVAFVPKLLDYGSNFDELERTIWTIVPASHLGNGNQQKDLVSTMQGGTHS
jgi:DNA-binding NtrC family response regulator